MICPKHAYEHKTGDMCPALVYWKQRTGFSNIVLPNWSPPSLRIERGAWAKRVKAYFRSMK